jgi:hydroxyethylthiazole kinase-like uncharacterized protein yjeF
MPPQNSLPRSKPLYRAAGLRALESAASDQSLMQRAGLAAADLACELMRDAQQPVLMLVGPGNNGGDGYEAAMHLLRRGHDVRLTTTGDVRQPPDAIAARERFLAAGGEELKRIPEVPRWALIVDALFGIGLARPLTGPFAGLVADANLLARRDNCALLALDCPSGLDADTGRVLGPAVIRASHTLTFIAGKPGLLTADGPDCAGLLSLAELGLDAPALVPADGHSIAPGAFSAHLCRRRRNSHKGSNGNAGIVGGAAGMLGAALLAGRAALQLGAGRTYVGCLDDRAPAFDPLQPELMLRQAPVLLATALDALACGPGLGTSEYACRLLGQACALEVPLLLDADALNLLASDSGNDLDVAVAARRAPTLLTPHPAEVARLLDSSVADVQSDRIAAALELAERFNAHVALKGCGTVLATPEGNWSINTTGNPGMGSAGMGDVLSGIVVALLAQGWPAAEALAAGVHLHGAAADALASTHGEIGITAGETIAEARRLLNCWIDANA